MRYVTIQPGRISGRIRAPASKSISHRSAIAAALAGGVSRVDGLTFSEDLRATIGALVALGAGIEIQGESILVSGNDGFRQSGTRSATIGRESAAEAEGTTGADGIVEIDCGESGSTLRFLIPLALASARKTRFLGRGKLPFRPLDPYFALFDEKGIRYRRPPFAAQDNAASGALSGGVGAAGPAEATKENIAYLPLEVSGSLPAGTYRLPGDVSSQFVSGLLFALPLVAGDSEIILESELESRSYVDLTLGTMAEFGVGVKRDGYRSFAVSGSSRYVSRDYRVEGDYSQAAALLAAGLLAGEATVLGLKERSAQGDRAFIDIARRMGGRIVSLDGGFRAESSALRGTDIDVSQCPDLMPVLAVLGALAEGTTRILNARRLRLKESDRLASMASVLGALGCRTEEAEDAMVIHGGKGLAGGSVEGRNDHRIVMAASVAALACRGAVTISGAEAIAKSYPAFFDDLSSLGAAVAESGESSIREG